MAANNPKKPVAHQDLQIPDIVQLAKLYRACLENSDSVLAAAAESAAVETAAAEGMLAEAIAVTRFVNEAAV